VHSLNAQYKTEQSW